MRILTLAVALATASTAAYVHDTAAHGPAAHTAPAAARHTGGIAAKPDAAVRADFDIVHAKVSVQASVATFHMAVSGRAGASRPAATGKLAGSDVFSYVWPVSLDPETVGFERGAGTLALAVTAHPDFDDTPLFDENGDGRRDNDGDLWHSHWVVLKPTPACGEGALGVVDIPPGATPRLPKTWPGLPILIDSPGWDPVLDGDTVEVRVPFETGTALDALHYDGVAAGLRVNASVHAPLLCVRDVFKVASGDLSLPGRAAR
jgi:hypothetical protein